MILTRRNFFRNLIGNVVENIQDSIPQVMSDFSPKKEIRQIDSWISLGNFTDFPVGSKLTVNNNKNIVISTSEGLYVIDVEVFNSNERDPRILIKMEERGQIFINPNQASPVGTILSIMTGNLVIQEEI